MALCHTGKLYLNSSVCSRFRLDKIEVGLYHLKLKEYRKEVLETRRVRTNIGVAAVVYGALFVSLLIFLGRPGKGEEKVGVRPAQNQQAGGKEPNTSRRVGSHRARKERSWLPAEVTLRLSREPRPGETAGATFTITPLKDVPQMKVIWGRPLRGVEIVGGEKVVYCSMKKGETRSFSVQINFVSSPVHFGVVAGHWWYATKLDQRAFGLKEGDERFGLHTGASIYRLIVDEATGQFGTLAEWLNHPSRRVFMLYNHLEAEWMSEPDQGFERTNRMIAEGMKDFEPALSDSEALCLHADNYALVISGIGDPGATDAERTKHLLEAGWLKAHRDRPAVKEKWLKEFMGKNKDRWVGESKLNRSDGDEEKTAVEWLEEYYGESFGESEGEESPERAPEGSLEAQLEIDHAPKLGETARITLTVASTRDFPRVRIGIGVGRVRNVDKPPGIEIVSWPDSFEIEEIPSGDVYCMMSSQLKKDERRAFGFVIKVTSEGVKSIGGGVAELAPIERRVTASDDIFLDVGEKETKVSKTMFPPPPEYWATPLIQGTGPMMDLELMREGMEAFIKEAPGLTRWEARWLMDKVEHSIVVEGIPYEEAVRKALRKVLREGRRFAHKGRIGKLQAFKLMVEDWKKNRPADR